MSGTSYRGRALTTSIATRSVTRKATSPRTSALPTVGGVAYPLRVSVSGRYLEDQNGQPFLIVGSSEWTAPYNLLSSDMELLYSTRAGQGFNTTIMIGLGSRYDGGQMAWQTLPDSIRMFSVDNSSATADMTTVQGLYLARLDQCIQIATKWGFHIILVVMDADDAGQSSLNPGVLTMRNNTPDQCYAMGKVFAQRYAAYPNITISGGVDFQSYNDSTVRNGGTDAAKAKAIQNACRDYMPWAIQTVELPYGGGAGNVNRSAYIADSTWFSGRPSLDLDWIYSHFCPYDPFYASGWTGPKFLGEGDYEGDPNSGADATTLKMLRQMHCWAALSGCAGQLYGNHITWPVGAVDNGTVYIADTAWKTNLATTGATHFLNLHAWLKTKSWWLFVPAKSGYTGDTGVATAGYGTPVKSPSGTAHTDLSNNDYCATVRTSDGRAVYSFVPSAHSGTLTIDMTKLSGSSVVGRWYDVTNNGYTAASGSPYTNSGTHAFSTPGSNSAGDGDWILCLES